MGEYDLMRLAFLLDLGLYYLGVAAQPFRRGFVAFKEPMFSPPVSVPFYHFMKLYNRRFARMGRKRRERNCWGRQNNRQRFMFPGYTFAKSSSLPIIKAMFGWGWLELKEGWRSWFVSKTEPGTAAGASMAATADPVR